MFGSMKRDFILQNKASRVARDRYTVEAVVRALDLLEAFQGGEELTLTEIAERVGLNKSRVFRLLHSLAVRGYVERSADGIRYTLGVKLIERAACVRRDLRQLALPFMQRLHAQFNETVNLAILDRGEVLYIEMLESSHPFRMAAAVGSRSPWHSTALGKAMVAYLPEEERRPLLQAERLVRLTERTLTDRERLARELERVRRQGYAVDEGETERGAACIGAPILNREGRPVAALSLSGPVERILVKRQEIAVALVATCQELSRRMGFHEHSAASI
jgi:DNA-binding IclR family transcriptional regulator